MKFGNKLYSKEKKRAWPLLLSNHGPGIKLSYKTWHGVVKNCIFSGFKVISMSKNAFKNSKLGHFLFTIILEACDLLKLGSIFDGSLPNFS